MIYIRPTKNGYEAFDCYHEQIFSEENCRALFFFIESDTTPIKALLRDYFDTIFDADTLTIKEEKPPRELIEGIKKEMGKIHPHLASNQYITAFRMLAEHLNQVIFEHCHELTMTKEVYGELFQQTAQPLLSISTHPLPPIIVPTSSFFKSKYFAQLQAMYERPYHVAGLNYIEEVRLEAERYIFWVLDRSCYRFKDLDRDTRVRLYSRIFRENIIGPDIRMEHCCYWRAPEQYDYFGNTPAGKLLSSMQNDIPAGEVMAQIMESGQGKRKRSEMADLLRTITSDRQEITQDMKEFLNDELDSVASDVTATMFEEYRADNFDQLIRMQLWFLTKEDTIMKRCRHCGRLFVAERLSSDYCTRIKAGETEPCDIVGPKKSYARLMDEDPVLKTYNRVYKTIYARKKRGSITDDEFNRWKAEARSLLDKTRAGEMGEEAFEAWLTQDVRAWGK